MKLYLTAKTNIPDVYVDYIEVRLRSGEDVSLNWDESDISRTDDGFEARYKGVYFGEEYANGRIGDLEGFEITDIELYFETTGLFAFQIDGLLFEDGEKTLSVCNPSIPQECSGLARLSSMKKEMAVVQYLKGQGHPHPAEDGTLDEFMHGGEKQAMYDEAVKNNYNLSDVDRWFHLVDVMGVALKFETAMKIDRALYEEDLETMELPLLTERMSLEDKLGVAIQKSDERVPREAPKLSEGGKDYHLE